MAKSAGSVSVLVAYPWKKKTEEGRKWMKVWNKNTYYSTTLPLSRKILIFPLFMQTFSLFFLLFRQFQGINKNRISCILWKTEKIKRAFFNLAMNEMEDIVTQRMHEENAAFPLSQSQQNIWDLEKAYSGTSINHITTSVRIQGQFRLDLLQKSIRLLLESDSSLRTRIERCV